MVRAELDLEAVLRRAALTGEAGVVDEAVDRRFAREQLFGAAAHRGQIREIELDELDVLVAGLALDLVDDGLGLVRRAAREDDVVPGPRELARGDLADSGVRAGDNEGLHGPQCGEVCRPGQLAFGT